MFRYKKLKRLYVLLCLLNYFSLIKASGSATVSALPTCVTNTAPSNPCLNQSGGSALTDETICADKNLKVIYESKSNDCKSLTNAEGYFTYSCTSATKCTEADIASDQNILVYHYNGSSTLTQNKDDSYFKDGKLFICPKEVEGMCTLVSTEGYYINGMVTGTLVKAIIQCTGSGNSFQCQEINALEGSYINKGSDGSAQQLISCDSSGCRLADAVVGYKISGVNGAKKIIECTSETTACTLRDHNGAANKPTHFIEAADSGSQKVITCTDVGCKFEDVGVKGYFLNSGSDKNENPAISCDGGVTNGCVKVAKMATCNAAGKIHINGGTTVSLCIDASSTGAIKIESKSSGTAKFTDPITIADAGDFPGTDQNDEIIVKIGIDGTAILLEEKSLPECNAGKCVKDIYCFDGTVIKTGLSTTADTCNAIIGSSEGKSAVFFKSDQTKIETPSSSNVPDIAYLCTFREDPYTANSCELVKGYAKSGSNYVQCNGWVREGCTVKALASCAATDEGVLSNNKICFGTEGTTLTSTESTIAFVPSDINSSYGIFKDTITFLKVSTDYAIVDSSPTIGTKSYQRNYKVSNSNVNALIYCVTDKTDCVVIDANSGYYTNSGGDSATNKVIKCSNTGCTTESVESSCSKAGDIIYASELKLCTTSSDSTAFASQATDKFETIILESDNDFPGALKGKIGVKLLSDRSNAIAALLLEDASLPLCTNTGKSAVCFTGAEADQVCITSDGKLYKSASTSPKCSQITRSGDKGSIDISYYGKDFKEIASSAVDSSVAAKTPYYTYQCSLSFDSTPKLENCVIVKGYTNIGTKAVQCSGWKEVACVAPATEATCASEVGDGAFASTEICIDGTNDITLPTDVTVTQKVAFTLKDTSSNYGVLKDDILVLSISKTKAVVNNTIGDGVKYFMNHNGVTGSQNEIIRCEGEACTTEVNNVGYYIDYGTETTTTTGTGNTAVTKITYSQLISCPTSDTICTTVSSPGANYYIDASSAESEKRTETDATGEESEVQYFTKLIYCDANQVCESVSHPESGYYISATPENSKLLTNALIECTESPVGCKIISASQNTIYINSAEDGMLIQCSDDTKGCKAYSGSGTESVPVYYMNAATSSTEDESYTDHIIKCSNTACEIQSGMANGIYLNGNIKGISGSDSTDENQLIQCTDGVCEGIASTTDSSEYYFNAGKYGTYPLIKCTKSGTTVSCVASEAKLGKGNPTDAFYINGDYDPTNPGDKKYLIKCTTVSQCEFYGETKEEIVEHYVHGDSSSTSNAIIECSIEAVDEETFGATCTFVSSVAKGNIYIDSGNKNLIQCYSTTECASFKGVIGSATIPAYFVNAAADTSEDDFKGFLIKCSGEGTCEEADGVSNGIFINSNFKDSTITTDNPNNNGDTTNHLISCTDDDGCLPKPGTVNGYYVNSGYALNKASERKRTDNAYTNAMIQCASTKTSPCTPVDGGEDYVYLNGNSSVDNNYLIICNSGTCSSVEGVSSDSSKVDYYINSGHNNENVLKDSLISCDDSKCEALDISKKITSTVTELFYLNTNYGIDQDSVNYLIKCDAHGCTPYGTANPRDGDVEHYINGAKSGSDPTDAVIRVSFAPSPPPTEERKRAASNSAIVATCTLVDDAEENNVFINSFSGKLIQCTKTDCTAFQSTGTKDIPAYYVNSAKESDENYKGLIIKCTHEKCTLLEGIAANNVYLNANMKGTQNGDNVSSSKDENQLIICADSKCETVASELEAAGSEYYINSGEYSDGTDVYVLIKCVYESSAKCSAEKVDMGKASELFYINNNYKLEKDSENYLIKCTSKTECILMKNPNSKEGKEHYIHGAPDGLKNAVIECEMTASSPSTKRKREVEVEKEEEEEEVPATEYTATCNLIEDSGENNVYINSSDPKQIIRCIATGCKAENSNATDKSSGYYINTAIDGTTKSLIKCVKANCDEITADALKEIEGHKIFLNANYLETSDTTHPLIKCTAEGECDIYESSATDDLPEFYINSDLDAKNEDYDGVLKTDIIKCTTNSDAKATLKIVCTASFTIEKDYVFINSNFDATANKKQIIKCSGEEGCNEFEVYADGEADSRKYYVNAGTQEENKLKDTLIECTSASTACTIKEAKPEGIYINANTNELIYCTDSANGCKAKESGATKDKYEYFLNSSDIEYETDKNTNDLIKCSVNKDGEKVCSPANGEDKKVYINSFNTSQVIYCLDDIGCTIKSSTAEVNKPQYFVNGDVVDFEVEEEETTEELRKRTEAGSPPVDAKPLKGDLIKCKNTGTKITCEVTDGTDGHVYLNGNFNSTVIEEIPMGETTHQLIKCSEKEGCLLSISNVSDDKLPEYYLNSGNEDTNKLKSALIQCVKESDGITCGIHEAKANEVYRNDNENQKDQEPIIKCTKSSCKPAMSNANSENKEYYLNAGKIDDTALNYDVIECSVDSSSNENDDKDNSSNPVVCVCLDKENIDIGVYLNSNYAESGDNNQLIKCSNDNGCTGSRSQSTTREVEYYVNAEATNINNAIIFCSNKKCEKQTPTGTPAYYVGIGDEGNVNGLIECNEFTSEAPAESTTTEEEVLEKRGTELKCKLKSGFTSSGYYLNSGYNKAVNQTIICDSSDGCSTLKVDLGYYVNAGDTTNPIIRCEKEGAECVTEESKSCPSSEKAEPGNYCYEDGQLKFFASNNSTAVSASKSDDYYIFATIPSGGFPGIKGETNTLFKVSRYFINRFYQSGIVMIDKNGKLVDSLSTDQTDMNIYDCNDSTKTCSEKPGCTDNTYMFDSENKKAVFCNAGKLEYAEITGYVVDSNRAVGTNHPYIIQCQNNGSQCKSIKPNVSSYFENNGYDSGTNNLIQCSSNNCITVQAEVGYYVGHEGEGIIQCTSSTSCTYSKAKSKNKYVNAGANKSSYAIISCNKNKGCSAIKANIGYYLTYSSSLLIHCSSPSNCVEFTPTVNYYDNADSSESSNTIINCTQNSQVISCAPEATNNGFYMSSSPNVLIRCKSGSKCKSIKVKNGIFRGAIKALVGSSKRSDDEKMVVNERGIEATESEEDEGRMITMPRDSDESYDIIRCIAEKCSALSSTEVASIPICEFNNNKCYITLEYAMTKSATTSISAGNICTNADRSIFYFATDTVVVKPNVISGVTATYVYTTTNSNCLEVNDSYDDMYFTVGSNIYLLDQGSIIQFYESGYYFINTAKNTLVTGNDIDAYNDENVKLYCCNGNSCSIEDKPEAMTYYVDVNKRIVRYNINSDAYSFAYDKDVTCIFANNKCTPNADLKNKEFCVTYKGELVLAKNDIKNRETGECYKASTIGSNIYGYSQYLYQMNLYSAKMVDETGYYIVSLSTNTTVVSKNYKTKNNNLVIYGCQLSSCKEYLPEEDKYYYDARAKNILRYQDGIWKSPSTSGYAYISIDPSNTYIYRFTKNLDEIKINAMANYGYYYTVDGEMYHCDRDEDGECSPIDNTGYYFTNAGEVYQCIHDSEELEPTECVKQACVSGQYYYIDEAYYRCESSSSLVPVMSRYCSYNENVVINFPLALTDEYPEKIKQAMEGIEKNNNSTAIVSRRSKNYLESVSGIFTNCTYNVEETKSTFDLVCVNNYVSVDEETDDIKICSMEQLGYVECVEDEENPEKCNVSGGISRLSLSIISIIVSTMLVIILTK